MIINNNQLEYKKMIICKLQDFCTIDFNYTTPFCINFNGSTLLVEKIVRLIKKKRMVVFGSWQGTQVVAKIFFDKHFSKRHYRKDLAGIKILTENNIATPSLWYQGISDDQRVYMLIFKRIFINKSTEEIVNSNIESVFSLLQKLVTELAVQHSLGIMQNDLHLNNFLFYREKIYTLDGSQLKKIDKPLSRKNSINSLSLLFSQLKENTEKYIEMLFNQYASARGWIVEKTDLVRLVEKIKKYRLKRWGNLKIKLFRESTNFFVLRNKNMFAVSDRYYLTPALARLLKNPEYAFHCRTAIILKNGRSSTIIKIKLDNRELVIKRYNLKNIWHFLRRCLRQTRAATSWKLANKLIFFGINTAKPIAFVNKKNYCLNNTSYFLMEYVPNSGHLDHSFICQHEKKDIDIMIESVITMLKNLAQLNMTHGDLKSSNILMDGELQPILIDLDGTVEHHFLSKSLQIWKKEIRRFLENFQQAPHLQEQWERQLKKVLWSVFKQ